MTAELELDKYGEPLINLSDIKKEEIRDKISTLLGENQGNVLENNDIEKFLNSGFFGIFLSIVLNSDKFEHKNFSTIEKGEADFNNVIQEFLYKGIEEIFKHGTKEKVFLDEFNEVLINKIADPDKEGLKKYNGLDLNGFIIDDFNYEKFLLLKEHLKDKHNKSFIYTSGFDEKILVGSLSKLKEIENKFILDNKILDNGYLEIFFNKIKSILDMMDNYINSNKN